MQEITRHAYRFCFILTITAIYIFASVQVVWLTCSSSMCSEESNATAYWSFNGRGLIPNTFLFTQNHYIDVIMTTMASQITSLTVVYSIFYSGADQRKHQSSASLAFVLGNSPGPVNSPHKRPVTRKMFPFDDVIMGVHKHIEAQCRIYVSVN